MMLRVYSLSKICAINKWVLVAGYNPKKQCIFHFIENIGSSLDKFIESFDNLLIIGAFNSEVEEEDRK